MCVYKRSSTHISFIRIIILHVRQHNQACNKYISRLERAKICSHSARKSEQTRKKECHCPQLWSNRMDRYFPFAEVGASVLLLLCHETNLVE